MDITVIFAHGQRNTIPAPMAHKYISRGYARVAPDDPGSQAAYTAYVASLVPTAAVAARAASGAPAKPTRKTPAKPKAKSKGKQ